MYKKYYSRFLEANKGVQHYASHSHHYWPDVTREATLEYWDDSAKYVDAKWDYFFSHKLPDTQKLIAEVLNLSAPEQIVFAPNTHEFVIRLLSCFDPNKKMRILTTDSEFYSFDRQINRLLESSLIEAVKVKTKPYATFEDRFISEIKSNTFDFIFLSHVFFNSGVVVKNINAIVKSVTDPNTLIAIDGYHGFMAVPTNLSAIESRAFYMGGSYKYAQGGEGCCFLSVPKNSKHRPLNTGWFAGHAHLSTTTNKVEYPDNGFRFAGATMDFTALYRLNAVLKLFKNEKITVSKVHAHIQKLQNNFRTQISQLGHSQLNEVNILRLDYSHHGHFLTFDLDTPEKTQQIHDLLKSHHILTDFRGSNLRFGFGLYQEDFIDLSALIS